MTLAIVILILLGYLLICSEHITRVNKATVAVFCGVTGWVLFVCDAPAYMQGLHAAGFQQFMGESAYSIRLVNQYIYEHMFVKYMVQLCNIVMYLLATMAIVELLSNNGCFQFLTDICRSKNSKRVMFCLAFFSFILSANLDNLTSSVIMLTVLNKIIINPRQRMFLGAIIVIATNCGGCFTVIGDVTSMLIWTRGAVTPTNYSGALVLPALVATVVPTVLIGRHLPDHLDVKRPSLIFRADEADIPLWQRLLLLFLGIAGLWFVPTFYRLTNLPPFLGAFCVLGVLWVVNEIINRKSILSDQPISVSTNRSLQYETIQMIMFFVGVGLCVDILVETGVMKHVAYWCDQYIHNIYLMSLVLGFVSAVMDNVALVLTSISIYPIQEMSNSMSPYLSSFVENGQYWHLISLSGCVGGCLLPIGNTAGYALMKSEGVGIWWYVRYISGKVLLGWLCSLGVYFLVDHFLR